MHSGAIYISDAAWRELVLHLLPPNSHIEEAAFVMANDVSDKNGDVELHHVETIFLGPSDFDRQENDYLELNEKTRANLIKKAHDQKTCLIEFHSHPGPRPACLSMADMTGLGEFVPHVRWRLEKKPYAAIVVANGSFDGLIWANEKSEPSEILKIQVDGEMKKPTGISIGAFRKGLYGQI